MSNVLVAYFSFGGVTAKAAKDLAEVERADLFEIRPEVPYTAADVDYTNKRSRSTLEMTDPECRPAMACKVENMAQYDIVFIGFPIWWGREPSVVDTFLEAHDFTGKRIVPFCTSGGNDAAKAADRIRHLVPAEVTVDEGKRLGGDISIEDLKLWTEGIK